MRGIWLDVAILNTFQSAEALGHDVKYGDYGKLADRNQELL